MIRFLKVHQNLSKRVMAMMLSVLLLFAVVPFGASAGVTLFGESYSLTNILSNSWSASNNNGAWRAEYTTSNLEGVYAPMTVVADTEGSFSLNGIHGAQPAAYLSEGGLVLLANMWGSVSYWEMSAAAFVAPEDYEYRLNASIKVGHNDAFTAGNEGHVYVTKNGVKIWPTNEDYAVVNQDTVFTIKDLDVQLAKNDVVRIEAYGATIGATDRTNNGSWLNHVWVDATMTQIVAKDLNATYVTEGKSTAYDVLNTAWVEGAAVGSIAWEDYNWQADYTSANKAEGEWTQMVLTATEGSFSHNGTNLSQPSTFTQDGAVVLLANQWGSAGWWDKSGVSYVCTEAGSYLLSCDSIKPGSVYAFMNGNEGRLVLKKNGVKIWPADADYAVVDRTTSPVFETLNIDLQVGDVLRFEGYGAAVGATDYTNCDWASHIALNPAIEKIVDVSYKTPDVLKLNASAPAILDAAWKGSAETALNWGAQSWVAQYSSANTGGWTNMVRAKDTYGSIGFGHSATIGSQPCLDIMDGKVNLSSNQWGSTGWWDKAGLAFTAPVDGVYYVTCPTIKPAKDVNFANDGHEGRVVLTKNDVKVWPTNAEFASVTKDNIPEFAPMAIEMKKGDVLRFETVSALIGAADLDNGGNYYNNGISMDPDITLFGASVEYTMAPTLISGNTDLLTGVQPEVATFRDGEMITDTYYNMVNPENLTDRNANTSSTSDFNMGAISDAAQTLIFEFNGEAVVKQLQMLASNIIKYEVYVGDDMENLFNSEYLLYAYNNEGGTRSQIFTVNGYLKAGYVGIKITDCNSYPSISEIVATGYLLGDADGDKALTATDLVQIRGALLKDIVYKDTLDATENGKLNIKDLIRLKKMILDASAGVSSMVGIAQKPADLWVDPESVSATGYAAPVWMRDLEMYTEATHADGFATQDDIDTWGKYYDLVLGTWSNNIDTFKAAGKTAGSYFDPYHVYNRTDLAVKDANGYCLSDYMPNDSLYITCHRSDVVLDWAKEYVQNCLNFGAQGMFLDDIRAAYWAIPDKYQDYYAEYCTSTDHNHVSTGVNSHALVNSTVKELYKQIKTNNRDNYVILNGGDFSALRQDYELSYANIIKYSDAAMSEHYLYGSDGNRWLSPEWMIEYGSRFFNQGIENGKKHLVLTYSYDQMSSNDKIIEAVRNTLAFCRLYDFAWSDYNVLRTTSLPTSALKEIYGMKTGAAGKLGTYFGKVVDSVSGKALSGVTVSAGNVSVTTDANGKFTITPPVNQYTFTFTKDGYTSSVGTASGVYKEYTMKANGGNVYYVAPNGDNKNDGKSADKAFKSLNYADAYGLLKAGDTVVVAEGTYNLPNQTTYNTDGVTYVAKGDVTLRIKKGNGQGMVIGGENIVFDGFAIEGSSIGVGGLMTINGEGVEIQNCTFRDTAYYTAQNRLTAEAAVKINANSVNFHNNIFAGDIFANAALLVNGVAVNVYNNTFDGDICIGGNTATAILFGANAVNLSVYNNIFVEYDNAYVGYNANLGWFNTNVFSNIANSTDAYRTAGDKVADDVNFMGRANGDYALKRNSVAVNAGTNSDLSFRGESADIGAVESNFSNNYVAVTSNGAVYRTFADKVVVVNSSAATAATVTVPTGRAGVVLKEFLGANQWTADASGNVTVTVPAGASIILQAK